MARDPDPLLTLSQTSPRQTTGGVVASLTAVFPLDLAWHVALGDQPVTLGREGDARVPAIADRTVSRRHVGIAWDGAGHVARDLGARNGSRLGGDPLDDRGRALADGMVIQLGDVFLVYERGAAIPDDDTVATDSIPGRSAAVRRLRSQVARAAADPSPVLLIGETGTGKEWIAGELHRLGKRPGPLVALNCAALGASIIESQLFGHVKGSFTGAAADQPGLFRAADKGTLFLDEIGEMAIELQPKLLRALQDGQVLPVGATRPIAVDVRVIAATNRDLQAAIDQRTFRLDLYSRLALWEIAVPPLRARRVDLLAWLVRLRVAWHATRGVQRAPLVLLPDAVEAILLHDWPDNLRGLDRLVHAIQATSAAGPVGRADLPAWLAAAAASGSSAPVAPGLPRPEPAPRAARREPPTREEFTRVHEELAGNVRALARHFDRDRRQIYRWLTAYGLERADHDDAADGD